MFNIASIEAELIEESRPYMAILKMNTSLTDGTNPSLRAVIRDTIEVSGGGVADWPNISDGDLQGISVGPSRFMRIATIRLLEKFWNHWAKFDQRAGTTDQKLRDVAKDLQKRIAELKEELQTPGEIGGIPIAVSGPEIGQIKAGSVIPHDPFRWRRGPFPY